MSIRLESAASPPKSTWGAPTFARTFRIASVILLLAAGWLAWSDRQGKLSVDEPQRLLTGIPAGCEVILKFPIRNTTGRPVQVLAADNRCTSEGCSVTPGLPMVVPPGEIRSLEIHFKPRTPPYNYGLTLYTDDPNHSEIPILISGREPASKAILTPTNEQLARID